MALWPDLKSHRKSKLILVESSPIFFSSILPRNHFAWITVCNEVSFESTIFFHLFCNATKSIGYSEKIVSFLLIDHKLIMDLIAKALQTAFWFFVIGKRNEGVDRAGINNLLSASTSQQLRGLLLFSKRTTSMEMMMLVLVSAVAMLINPYAANPVSNNNLNRIIDLTEKYNRDLNEVRVHHISTIV